MTTLPVSFFRTSILNVMLCAILYRLCNSKNVKNVHEGVLLSVSLQLYKK